MHGQGIRPDERRRQEALGELAALGRVGVAVPRRKSHEIQEKAGRGLRGKVESPAAPGQGDTAASQVTPGFRDHGGTAHDDNLIRKIDAVMQVPGTQSAGDERAHLRGRGPQMGDERPLGRVIGDLRAATGGRAGLGDARARLTRQLTHRAGRVVDLAELRDLNAQRRGQTTVQVRLTPAIPCHRHVGIRERDDPGPRVPASPKERQRRRRAILQVIHDDDVGNRTRRLHAALLRAPLPRPDQLRGQGLDARQVHAQR